MGLEFVQQCGSSSYDVRVVVRIDGLLLLGWRYGLGMIGGGGGPPWQATSACEDLVGSQVLLRVNYCT